MRSKTLPGTLGALFLTLGAMAQSEFPVHEPPTGDPRVPEIAVTADGGFMVVWEEEPLDGSGPARVFGRRFEASGAPMAGAFQLHDEIASSTRRPVVASAPDGKFVALWQTNNQGLAGRRFTAIGAPLGREFELSNRGRTPDVEYAADGDFAVVWAEDADVVFQRFAPDATPRAAAQIVARDRHSPRMVLAANGEFAVTYTRTDYESPDGISNETRETTMARRLSRDGAPLGSELQVSPPETAYGLPDIASDANGRFLVVWEDYDGDGLPPTGTTGIGGQLFDPDGSRLGATFRVTPNTQVSPRVAATPGGPFLVVWGLRSDVRAQQIDLRGLHVGEEIQINDESSATPAVAPTPTGEFVTAWVESSGSDDTSNRLVGSQLEFPCMADGNTSCLDDGRFRVEMEWQDAAGRRGVANSVLSDTGTSDLLWFFAPENWEMLVKVINGCRQNGHYWVFVAGATDVAWTLWITDTETGESRIYSKAPGGATPAITDTTAFATCP